MSQTWNRAKQRVYHGITSLKPRQLKARWTGPRVLANSVPKSGTNLLTQCLSLFPMLRPSFRHVTMNFNRRPGTDELKREVNHTGRGQYTSGHVFYTPENAAVVERRNIMMPLIVRDPRDVVTSHFHYVAEKHPQHRLHDHYVSLPDDDARLMASICGVAGDHTADGDRLESIGEWMDAFLSWSEEPYVTVIRFEDLIGPKGGGSETRQLQTIRQLADHLDLTLSTDEVRYIRENVFSTDSSTFRKGLIGDWKNHFTPEHVDAFKQEAGDWLVKMGYEEDDHWGIP